MFAKPLTNLLVGLVLSGNLLGSVEAGTTSPKAKRQIGHRQLLKKNPHVQHLFGGKIQKNPRQGRPRRTLGPKPLDFRIANADGDQRYSGPGADAKIVGFHSPSMDNHQGQALHEGPGDTVRFEMTVQWGDGQTPGEHLPFAPAVHTNANEAPNYSDYPMQLVEQRGNSYRFAANIPIWRIASYRATGVLAPRDEAQKWKAITWAGHDVVFRPYAANHDRIASNKVSIMNLGGDSNRIGTFEDMMGDGSPHDNGRYTLQYLANAGFTAVQLNPIQPRTESPYTSTSLFDVWTKMSAPAQNVVREIEQLEQQGDPKRLVPGLKKKATRLALKSLKAYIDEAHRLGMQVHLDVVRNHIDANATLNDVVFFDGAGNEIDIFDPAQEGRAEAFSVRKNDPRQVIKPDGEEIISEGEAKARFDAIKAAGEPLSISRVAPWMYGKADQPAGAASHNETIAGGWGMWGGDTRQLNTGSEMEKGPNGEYLWRWKDHKPNKYSRATRNYLRRELALWVLLGVDGFRFDHAQGTTTDEWENGYNDLHRVAWAYRKTNLYMNAEDFNTENRTKLRTDTIEAGGSVLFLKARDPHDFRSVVDGWVGSDRERTVSGNHDEEFGNTHFQNPKAYAQRLALVELAGGPSLTKFGDQRTQMYSHRYFMDPRDKPFTLTNSNPDIQMADDYSAVARRAKRDLPALAGRDHEWLQRTDGTWDKSILAVARFARRNKGNVALVFSNFNGERQLETWFKLSPRVAEKLHDDRMYMAYSPGQMKFPTGRTDTHAMWSAPVRGADLKNHGLYIRLLPNETQILDMQEVIERNGQWVPASGRTKNRSIEITPGAVNFEKPQ